jgi:hypothetical protein
MSDVSSAIGGQPSSGNAASQSFRDALNSGNQPQSGPPTSVREALRRSTDDQRPRNDRPDDSNDSRSTNHVAGKPEGKPRDVSPKTDSDRDAKPNMRTDRSQDRAEPERKQSDSDLDLDRKVRVKVNGQEKEIPLRDALDYYQRGESANRRFQEAAELRKEAETAKERAERLLRDPKALVDALINDENGAKTVHEAYQEMLRLAQMTPDQQQEYLRVKELENKAASMERIEREQQAQLEAERENKIIDQHLDGLEDAFEKLGWMPSEKMQDVTDMLAASLIDEVRESGMKGVTYRHIAGAVKDAIDDMVNDTIGSLDDDALRSLIGEKRLRQLMAADVKQAQSRLPQRVPKDQTRQPTGQFAARETSGPAIHYNGDLRGWKALLDKDR